MNMICGEESTSTNAVTLSLCQSVANQQVSRSVSPLLNTTTLPYCEDGTLFLFSVTADSWEEQQILQETLNAMPNELRELVNKHGRVFSPPDHEASSQICQTPYHPQARRRPHQTSPIPPPTKETRSYEVTG